MVNRYTRDELLHIALDLVDSAPLNNTDRKGGLISSEARSIKWLNEAMDSFHSRYPFSADVTAVNMSLQASLSYLVLASDTTRFLPTDFIIDCKDGIVVQFNDGFRRLKRLSFQKWLDRYNASFNRQQGQPDSYTIFGGKIQIAPVLNTSWTAVLWYYARPSLLKAEDISTFPDEYVLIEFVRLKALEHLKAIPPGTATQYMHKEMGRLKQAGLLNEPEDYEVQIEQSVITGSNLNNRNAWMIR